MDVVVPVMLTVESRERVGRVRVYIRVDHTGRVYVRRMRRDVCDIYTIHLTAVVRRGGAVRSMAGHEGGTARNPPTCPADYSTRCPRFCSPKGALTGGRGGAQRGRGGNRLVIGGPSDGRSGNSGGVNVIIISI